ncbi:MAG: efflux RND transporter periplasmic adaptor subunit [Lachnospiraceae bacterium]|nr:efflux RND transporter periplasmic adaptor subunit [Lachnospiraceae bacterium]
MKKSAKILIGVAAVAVAAGILVPRLLKKDPPIEAVPNPNVTVESPVRADISLESGLIGTVQPSDIVYVIPKVAGEISEVYVKAGDTVTEGQALCKIDNSKQIDNARIQMESAAVAMQNAQAALNRMQVLYSTGDISAQTFEQTQAQTQGAVLQYEAAKLGYDTQVEFGTVTAPISGTLESVNMEVHSMASQSTQLCVITGEGVRKVVFAVPERIQNQLQVGDRIRLQKQGTEYEAVITKLASMISMQTGLFDVEATVEKGEALAAGSTVKLYVVSDRTEDAVTLPVDAVYYDGGDSYVYTCEGTTVHKVMVETGIFDEERIEILSGVEMGDQVIVTWSSELYEGSQVNPMTRDQEAAAGQDGDQAADQTENPDAGQTEANAQ